MIPVGVKSKAVTFEADFTMTGVTSGTCGRWGARAAARTGTATVSPATMRAANAARRMALTLSATGRRRLESDRRPRALDDAHPGDPAPVAHVDAAVGSPLQGQEAPLPTGRVDDAIALDPPAVRRERESVEGSGQAVGHEQVPLLSRYPTTGSGAERHPGQGHGTRIHVFGEEARLGPVSVRVLGNRVLLPRRALRARSGGIVAAGDNPVHLVVALGAVLALPQVAGGWIPGETEAVPQAVGPDRAPGKGVVGRD